MTDCTFCGSEIHPGTGFMYVKKEGKILYFCGKKCEKNMLKLGRAAKDLLWTKEGRREKAERLKLLKQEQQ